MRLLATFALALAAACTPKPAAAPPAAPRPPATTAAPSCGADAEVPIGEAYRGTDWAGVVCANGEQVGVLDSVVESPAWELLIVGRRGGAPFELRGRLRKVYYFAVVTSVELHDRRLTVTLRLDDDYGADVDPGIYHYWSDDGGATFSGPAYEPMPSTEARWLETSADGAARLVLVRGAAIERVLDLPWIESTTVQPLAVLGGRSGPASVLALESEWCECSQPPQRLAWLHLRVDRWKHRPLFALLDD